MLKTFYGDTTSVCTPCTVLWLFGMRIVRFSILLNHLNDGCSKITHIRYVYWIESSYQAVIMRSRFWFVCISRLFVHSFFSLHCVVQFSVFFSCFSTLRQQSPIRFTHISYDTCNKQIDSLFVWVVRFFFARERAKHDYGFFQDFWLVCEHVVGFFSLALNTRCSMDIAAIWREFKRGFWRIIFRRMTHFLCLRKKWTIKTSYWLGLAWLDLATRLIRLIFYALQNENGLFRRTKDELFRTMHIVIRIFCQTQWERCVFRVSAEYHGLSKVFFSSQNMEKNTFSRLFRKFRPISTDLDRLQYFCLQITLCAEKWHEMQLTSSMADVNSKFWHKIQWRLSLLSTWLQPAWIHWNSLVPLISFWFFCIVQKMQTQVEQSSFSLRFNTTTWLRQKANKHQNGPIFGTKSTFAIIRLYKHCGQY